MRRIEIIDDVTMRFPERGSEFDLGVEVGASSVLIAQGYMSIEREISAEALEQLRPIADRYRYALTCSALEGGMIRVRFERFRRKPQLRVV